MNTAVQHTRPAEVPEADEIFGRGPRHDSAFTGRLIRAVSDSGAPVVMDDATRNDVQLVTEFALTEGRCLARDHAANRWYVFTGHTYEPDRDGAALRCLIGYLQTRLQEAAVQPTQRDREAAIKQYSGALRAGKLERLLELAGHQHPIAVSGDEWDGDHWVLGHAGGVIDLRTGDSRPGEPQDKIRRSTKVQFDPAATCPRWRQFLAEVLPDDDTRRFVQRAIGYTLTGQITEQVFFLLIGSGSNGKSVLLSILRLLLGDYAATVSFSSLTRRRDHGDETPSSDLAALPGVRVVTASEVKDGAAFDEARVKAITGGDPLTCRHLYGRFFSFVPVFKLWMAVNHLPRVRDDSHSFWRRVRLVPFREQFDGARRDDRLVERLTDELPGILNWAVDGCRAWQEFGLRPSTAMVAEADSWKTDNDPLAGFLDSDRVEFDGDARTASSDLHAAYIAWAAADGLPEAQRLSRIAFGKRMAARAASVKSNGRTMFMGLRVR